MPGPPLGANNSSEKKSRSSSVVVGNARNAIPEVINHGQAPPKRHNMTARHHSVDALAPAQRGQAKQVSRYQGSRRARELEQHLRDKYGLPEVNHLRRTNSHSSLTQFSAESMIRTNMTLTRRKSAFDPPEFGVGGSGGGGGGAGPKSYTHLRQHHVGLNEPRDSKLRYLGRMSPEEQVDKYLKSVEKVNEARMRQMRHRQEYRTMHDNASRHYPPHMKINTSMSSSRWHSLDSVSRPVLVKNIKDLKKKNGPPPASHLPASVSVATSRSPRPQAVQGYREKADLKSYTSMPQIGGRRKTSPQINLRKASESSESNRRCSPEEKMSTSSDNRAKSRESTPADDTGAEDFVDSCSCTDVTLDETLKINHNHR